ncbi:MAG: hypothetical protein IT207_01860, partial [Fimbriimonadaceae bacterium]|nr:hypothetical protein [Fimbriimonadaceae bacterium]
MKRTLITLGALALVATANAQSLYNNATGGGHTLTLEGLFTDPNGLGNRASALQTALGNNVFGFGAQTAGPNMMSDDFVVPAGQNWTVTALTFFMYQTGATTPTINGLSWRIDNVNPTTLPDPVAAAAPLMSGGVLLADVPTVTFTDLFRVTDTALTGTTRRIQKVVVDTTGDLVGTLPPGQYWVTWSATGTLASGPWQPPLTEKGFLNNAPTDAKQWIGSTLVWNDPVVDNGAPLAPQDLPFWIDGTPGGAEVVVPSSFTTVLGRLDAGDVASLSADDDNYLRHCKFIVPNAL